MSKINSFKFQREKFEELRKLPFGKNWPVVYVLENGKEVYIGETTNAFNRSVQHIKNPDKKRLKNIHVISDPEYNKSATLDIESNLIQHMAADGLLKVQNGNKGLQNHSYFDKARYVTKFETIWDELKQMRLVEHDLIQIQNSDVFKYSPYKSLTEDQLQIAEEIFVHLKRENNETHIVQGGPGTGKSVLATYLVKFLKEQEETESLEIGLVVPMTSLRKTLRRVFKNISGLNSSMVVGPNDVTKLQYDVLIVDEAHRLKQRKNITNYKSFDDTNKKLNLPKDATELDWILKSSKTQILFYDEGQSVRPADIDPHKINNMTVVRHQLHSQMRIGAGHDFINFIDDLFALQDVSKYQFDTYDFQFFENIDEMISTIRKKDSEHGLARIVAGYAWAWNSRNNPEKHDIEIEGRKLKWNSVTQDWVNSPNALNEVGCIHTVQGYDLNYVGVIIGPELSYDLEKKTLVTDKSKYRDTNGHRGVNDPEELHRYIINIYKTLLTRGIRGAYLYVVDENLRKILKERLSI